MIPAAPGRVLGSVTPDVLPSRQHHCMTSLLLGATSSAPAFLTVPHFPCARKETLSNGIM